MTLVSQEVIQQLIVLFHIKACYVHIISFKYQCVLSPMIVSVCSEKNLHVYFLYLSIDILVLGMQFSNVHACLSVCGFFLSL